MCLIYTEHDTNPDKPKYRPPFLDHFDRKKLEAMNNVTPADFEQKLNSETATTTPTMPLNNVQSPNSNTTGNQQPQPSAPIDTDRQRYQSHLQLQLNQISAANQMGMQHMMHHAAGVGGGGGVGEPIIPQRQPLDVMKYPRNFVDSEFEFVRKNMKAFFYIFFGSIISLSRHS